MSIVLQSSGGGQITIQEPATASNFTQTLPAATGTVVVSGTTPSLNGITFPATQVPSADANTLDDYEEGTWTPTLTSGFTSPTYSNQVGTYTKVGNIVTFSIFLNVNGGTRAGSLLTFSLPFVAKNVSGNAGAGSWAYVGGGVINSITTNLPMLYVASNSTSLNCYKTDGVTFLGTDLVNNVPEFYLSGSYLTA